MLLQVRPRSLNYGDVFKGESKTMPVVVVPWEGTRFDIVDLESSKAEFQAEVAAERALGNRLKEALASARERLASRFGAHNANADTVASTPELKSEERKNQDLDTKNAKTIDVTLLPSAPLGRLRGKIKIHTDLKEKPVLEVPITANVVGNFKVQPPNQNFGRVKRGEGREAILKIHAREGTAARITRVEKDSEYISAEILDSTPSSEYELKIAVLAGAPVGYLNGTVTVHTTDEDQPKLKIKYYSNVKD
jgi:hypothetical protein